MHDAPILTKSMLQNFNPLNMIWVLPWWRGDKRRLSTCVLVVCILSKINSKTIYCSIGRANTWTLVWLALSERFQHWKQIATQGLNTSLYCPFVETNQAFFTIPTSISPSEPGWSAVSTSNKLRDFTHYGSLQKCVCCVGFRAVDPCHICMSFFARSVTVF